MAPATLCLVPLATRRPALCHPGSDRVVAGACYPLVAVVRLPADPALELEESESEDPELEEEEPSSLEEPSDDLSLALRGAEPGSEETELLSSAACSFVTYFNSSPFDIFFREEEDLRFFFSDSKSSALASDTQNLRVGWPGSPTYPFPFFPAGRSWRVSTECAPSRS